MGQPTRDTTEREVVDKANRDKFIKETEGNRPPINDPRRDAEIKKELSPEEIKLQAEATEKWATQYLKSPITIGDK